MATTDFSSSVANRPRPTAPKPAAEVRPAATPAAPSKPEAPVQGAESAQTGQEVATKKVEAPAQDERSLDVGQSVEKLNDLMQSVRRELQFSVDDKSGRTVITVIDSETQEVVRQIPPEEVVTLMERLQTKSTSLMMDVKA